MTNTDITYLALYTGPCGPISHTFDAKDLDAAVDIVRADGRDWYDAASDVLDLNPDSDTLDVERALAGWELALEGSPDNRGYALYRRGAA